MRPSIYQVIPTAADLLSAMKPIRSLDKFGRPEPWIFIRIGKSTLVNLRAGCCYGSIGLENHGRVH